MGWDIAFIRGFDHADLWNSIFIGISMSSQSVSAQRRTSNLSIARPFLPQILRCQPGRARWFLHFDLWMPQASCFWWYRRNELENLHASDSQQGMKWDEILLPHLSYGRDYNIWIVTTNSYNSTSNTIGYDKFSSPNMPLLCVAVFHS